MNKTRDAITTLVPATQPYIVHVSRIDEDGTQHLIGEAPVIAWTATPLEGDRPFDVLIDAVVLWEGVTYLRGELMRTLSEETGDYHQILIHPAGGQHS
jgi:hypothetical protein